MNKRTWIFHTILSLLFLIETSYAADWPQFRGPLRDGTSTETGLLKQWPKDGPTLLWTADGLGKGWSSAAIAKGFVYIAGMIDKTGYAFCFDLNGKCQWKKSYGPEWTKSYPGTRSTPTVHQGRLYIMSGLGTVYCLDAKTGDPIWSREVLTEFDGTYPRWGISESLLIDQQKVICTPGGTKASVVALDKLSGELIWACRELTEPSAYGNPLAIVRNGKRIIVTMLKDSVSAIDAETGKLLWQQQFDEYLPNLKRLIHPNVPIYYKDAVYTTSGYDNGGAMIQLFDDPTRSKRKWTDKTLDTHHGGQVRVGEYIYGSNSIGSRGNWVCLDWNTGKTMYEDKWLGNKGSIIYADGMLYCYDENKGQVALAQATTGGFKPVSSLKITEGKGKQFWAHPSISDGKLYIRHDQDMMVYDIKEK